MARAVNLLKAFRGYGQTAPKVILSALRKSSLLALRRPASVAVNYMKTDTHDRVIVKREVRRRKIEVFGKLNRHRCKRCRDLKISCYKIPDALREHYSKSLKCTGCYGSGNKCEKMDDDEEIVDLSGETGQRKRSLGHTLRSTRIQDRQELVRRNALERQTKHGPRLAPVRDHDYPAGVRVKLNDADDSDDEQVVAMDEDEQLEGLRVGDQLL